MGLSVVLEFAAEENRPRAPCVLNYYNPLDTRTQNRLDPCFFNMKPEQNKLRLNPDGLVQAVPCAHACNLTYAKTGLALRAVPLLLCILALCALQISPKGTFWVLFAPVSVCTFITIKAARRGIGSYQCRFFLAHYQNK